MSQRMMSQGIGITGKYKMSYENTQPQITHL